MVFTIPPSARRAILSSQSPRLVLSVQRKLLHWRSNAVPSSGIATPAPLTPEPSPLSKWPFHFETGYAICPKRPPRPLPPPFVSPPSSSFSDPLTTHDRNQDVRASVNGELVRGLTNGDDAILVSENFLGVNDGVGAWATKEQGHAA